MLKYILALMVVTTASFGATVAETVAKEELEKNAKCEFTKESTAICINYYCSDITNDEERNIADGHYREKDCGKPWNEKSRVSGVYSRFCR